MHRRRGVRKRPLEPSVTIMKLWYGKRCSHRQMPTEFLKVLSADELISDGIVKLNLLIENGLRGKGTHTHTHTHNLFLDAAKQRVF